MVFTHRHSHSVVMSLLAANNTRRRSANAGSGADAGEPCSSQANSAAADYPAGAETLSSETRSQGTPAAGWVPSSVGAGRTVPLSHGRVVAQELVPGALDRCAHAQWQIVPSWTSNDADVCAQAEGSSSGAL